MKFILLCSVMFVSHFHVLSQTNENDSDTLKNTNLPLIGLIKVSIIYPFEEGKTFDMDYYVGNHMPMVSKLLGPNLVKYSIEKGIDSGIPNTSLPFIAIGCFYVKNYQDYQAAIAPYRDLIRSDFINYTETSPVILISEVIR